MNDRVLSLYFGKPATEISADDRYSREDLDRLVDFIMMQAPQQGFQGYAIRGVYVSAAVVEQALMERLERMAGRR